MTESKFTKGEWAADKDDSYYHVMCGDHCVVTSFDGADDEANAHLIASAPDMYALLHELSAFLSFKIKDDTLKGLKLNVDALLAKARGE